MSFRRQSPPRPLRPAMTASTSHSGSSVTSTSSRRRRLSPRPEMLCGRRPIRGTSTRMTSLSQTTSCGYGGDLGARTFRRSLPTPERRRISNRRVSAPRVTTTHGSRLSRPPPAFVYVAGVFDTVDGSPRPGIAAFDSGLLTSWLEGVGGSEVDRVSVTGGYVYVPGPRAIREQTAELLAWQPPDVDGVAEGGPEAVAVVGRYRGSGSAALTIFPLRPVATSGP